MTRCLVKSLLVAILTVGCGSSDSPWSDGRDDVALLDGSNNQTNPCVRGAVLALLNDAAIGAEELRDLGVHSRAAKNIESTRNGEDRTPGTDDDVLFESLTAVDRVPYVGPVAMDALFAYGESACDGTADFFGEACFKKEALWIASNVHISADALARLGVPRRGANAIVDARNGTDKRSGTSDDVEFTSWTQLDAVRQVGEAALGALFDAGVAICEDDEQVVFSPQDYADSHLSRVKSAIENATSSIDVAMYSFRDTSILDALGDAVSRGVGVRVIFQKASEDRKSPEGTWSASLESKGIEVRWINKIMHHKFAIIDGPRDRLGQASNATIINGSGNWSYSAGTRYDENTVFVDGDEKLALSLQAEFNHLWDNGRPVVWNESIASIGHQDISRLDIERAAGSQVLLTSENFRTYESSTYGPTFTLDGNSRVVSDALVELIASADSSILIASGHLRSRAITEALAAKKADNPAVRIQVYLDGQEYISSWYHSKQLDDLEDCLNDAGTDTEDRQECMDEGYYFGYALEGTGIETRYKYYAYRWHYSYAEQMHHKYILVDGRTLATGSYNFSNNAEQNTMENVVLFDVDAYPTLVASFRRNFEMIWMTGEANQLYGALWSEIADEREADVPIVFDSMALSWEQVTKLKAHIRDNCANINDQDLRENPEDHWTCER